MDNQILLVDGPYLAKRSFYAPYHISTNTGFTATMIHSFLRTLNSLRKTLLPKQIIIAWESKGSWRRSLYPSYKPTKQYNRLFFEQLQDLQMILHQLHIPQYHALDNEADDVIATLAKKYEKSNDVFNRIIIFTVDKDIMQLINPLCVVYNGKEEIDEKAVKIKFGILPHQIPDYLAIVGDVTDGIDGIKGYGAKKSAKIIQDHGSIEKIPNDDPLMISKDKISINKQLATLRSTCDLLPVFDSSYSMTQSLDSILSKYNLNSIKEKMDEYRLLGKADYEKNTQ